MRLILGLHNLREFTHGCALTIGNFDGVHLGHQQVLQHLKDKAKALNLPTAVMIFEPQPNEFFNKNTPPARLMRLRDKLKALHQAGIDYVICIRFNQQFAQMSAETFIQNVLVEQLHVKFLSIGDDFHFGAERRGNFELLQRLAPQCGFQVENNHTYDINTLRVSSTAIRQALQQDNLDQAELLLGRQYSVNGRIAHGKKLGRTIGFPTANINLHRLVNPLHGVYAVTLTLDNKSVYQGVANIGFRPTVTGEKKPLLEVHLFDFEGSLYGESVEVAFLQKIRNEQKFESLNALQQQINRDIQQAKKYFLG